MKDMFFELNPNEERLMLATKLMVYLFTITICFLFILSIIWSLTISVLCTKDDHYIRVWLYNVHSPN